ncbi:PREDICTED: uncharacterized protein LOC109581873 [Amphimedon queenslandica]|uniref:Uncharacterized protein n=1 Tax=Amphimedon queenslandica TaxID=400682 RepID=A0AAN0J580_AMPQE|nr:PREDICTED: uncharacterized protein LOC109581873 [Amphimedon queenslandica]|eukprot:XP_019851901.1 PREDICTED: uncharacterized protein LOC109581873 [Amphimedon queenslandica]
MKEKSQLQERVTSLEEQSIKETRSIGQQFNLEEEQKNPPFSRFLILIYLLFISFVLTANYNSKQFIAPLPGVEIDASINQLVAGGSHTQLHWEEYGLTLEVPPDALPCGFIAEIAAYVSNSGPYYAASSNTWPTSTTVYWISSSKDFVTPVSLKIQLSHAVRQNVSSEIKVLMTDVRATQNVITKMSC